MEQKSTITGVINEVTNEAILSLLTELKLKGDMFNQMGGALYSAIIADEMTKVNHKLYSEYGVVVEYEQPAPGRVKWINLDSLIDKYSVKE